MVAREAAEDEVLRRDLSQQVESLTQRLQTTTAALAEKVIVAPQLPRAQNTMPINPNEQVSDASSPGQTVAHAICVGGDVDSANVGFCT